jgi:carbonic anhydrase
VVRNAGNLYTPLIAGSAAYAINHLGVKVIVVLGHQSCGAVNAARTLSLDQIKKERENLQKMLIDVKDGIKYCRETVDHISDPKARDRESVIVNAQVQVRKLSAEPGLKEKVASGDVAIVAAFYEITSGIVDFV